MRYISIGLPDAIYDAAQKRVNVKALSGRFVTCEAVLIEWLEKGYKSDAKKEKQGNNLEAYIVDSSGKKVRDETHERKDECQSFNTDNTTISPDPRKKQLKRFAAKKARRPITTKKPHPFNP
jgi:hypothetical protein